MARLEFHNVGAAGVIKDLPPHLLPPEAWSDARNVRFRDNTAVRIDGHSNVFGTLSGTPQWAHYISMPTTSFWMYGSLTKMYATDGSSHADITRAVGGDYGTTQDRLWNGGVLSGVPVFTNGVDVPQYWSAPGLGVDLAALPNWDANDRCRVIKPFRHFLIALYITKSGTVYPHRVKWSHPAEPGAVPTSWDIADATKDAGELDVDGEGVLMTGARLRNYFIIYKERSTHIMQYVGGNAIFRVEELFDSIGALGIHCVIGFNDGVKHFVATGEDFIVHNGQEVQSVLDRRWRRWLTNNIAQAYAHRSYVVENPTKHEIWFCFPETGQTIPTLAVIYNTHTETVSVRELAGGIPFIARGSISGSSGDTWDATPTTTWDAPDGPWDEQSFLGYQARLLQVNPNDIKLQQMDSGDLFNSSPVNAYLERTDLAFDGQDRQGNPKAGFSKRKLITRIWPKITGGSVNIRIGAREQLGEAISWADAQSFSPGTQKYLDFTKSGRLPAIRFESNINSTPWQLEGFDLEYSILGDL